MLQVILLSAMGMLTAALFIAKYQSQMFDISSRHFRFIELMHRRRLAMTSMLFLHLSLSSSPLLIFFKVL